MPGTIPGTRNTAMDELKKKKIIPSVVEFTFWKGKGSIRTSVNIYYYTCYFKKKTKLKRERQSRAVVSWSLPWHLAHTII